MSDSGAGATISFRQELLRKGVHLSSLWMAALILFWPWNDRFLFYFFLVCLILNLFCEFAYARNVPVITPIYRFFFGRMLRKAPAPGDWVVSGSPPVFLAAALTTLLFPRFIAAAALGVMLTADTAAALIGRRFGRHRLNGGKSVEGTLAFFVTGTCFAVLVLWYAGAASCVMLLSAAAGVFLAALAELFQKQLRLDDNLTIPVICGAVMALAFRFAAY